MSISLATKGIIPVSASKDIVSFAVCEPKAIPHEYGERCVKIKELKPIMVTKTSPYIYEEIEE